MINDERYSQLLVQAGNLSPSLLHVLKQVEKEVSETHLRRIEELEQAIRQAVSLLNGKSIPQYRILVIRDILNSALPETSEKANT